jgi:O-antigen/teichoic acid export membrane protein
VADLLRQLGPVAATSVISLVYLRLDVLLLARMDGPASAGVFAASFRLIEALFLFSGGIVSGAFPLLAAHVSSPRLSELSGLVARLLLGVAVPAAAALGLLAPVLIDLLFGNGFSPAATPLRILALAVVPIYLNALTTHLLVASGRGRALVGLVSLRLVVGLLLDLALIPALGARGAAVAVVGAELSLAAGGLAATRQQLSLSVLAGAGVAPALSAATMCLALAALTTFLPLRLVAGGLVYLASFLLLWKLGGDRVLPLRPAALPRS